MASNKTTAKKNILGTHMKKETSSTKGNSSTATNRRLKEENAKPMGNPPDDGGGTFLDELYESQLKKSIEEIDALKKNEEKLIKERDALAAKNQRLLEENAKLKAKSSNDGVASENRRLQDEVTELNGISSTDGTITDLQAENNRLTEELKKIKEQLDQARDLENKSKLKEEQDQNFKRRLEVEKSDLEKTVANQQKELDSLRDENKRIQQENTTLKSTSANDGTEKEVDDLNKKIQLQSNELKALDAEKKALQEEIAKRKETPSSDGGNTELESLKKKLENAEKSKLSEVNALKQQIEEEKKSKEECVNQIRNDSELDKHRKEQLQKLEKENKELKQRIEQLQRENKELIEDIDKRKEMRKKQSGSPASGDILALRQENESLRNRLSELAGAKLTEGNPNIADLSDKNRPTNLAENFSEIYDNEWTDALEELTDLGKKSETEGIKVLLDIIKNAYEFSSKQATSFYSCMSKGLNDIGLKDEKDWPLGVSKQIKDHRKSISVLVAKSLSKAFITTKHRGYGEATQKYAEACASLCWFMCVQDPPVYIDATIPTGTFNKDKYRAYTKSGQSYEFLVWPALYLHKDGQLLGKGIAQGS